MRMGGGVSIIWAAGGASQQRLFACLSGLAGPNAPVAVLGLEVVRLGCGGDAGRPPASPEQALPPNLSVCQQFGHARALRISIRRPFEDEAAARHCSRIPRPSFLLLLLLLLLTGAFLTYFLPPFPPLHRVFQTQFDSLHPSDELLQPTTCISGGQTGSAPSPPALPQLAACGTHQGLT